MDDPEVLRVLTSARELLQDHWTVGTMLSPEAGLTMCAVGAVRISELFAEEDISDLFLLGKTAEVQDDNSFWYSNDVADGFDDTVYRRALICLAKAMPGWWWENDSEGYVAVALRDGSWENVTTGCVEDTVINWNDSFDVNVNSLAEVLAVFDRAIGSVTDTRFGRDQDEIGEAFARIDEAVELVGV